MIGLLLSGGMDSVSIAWWKRPDIAITVDYGQRPAEAEIAAAGAVCEALAIPHKVVRADCSSLGSGDMAGRPPLDISPVPEWWPFRNQLILTLAGIASVTIGVTHLMIGTVASDSVHCDGKAKFVEAMSGVMSLQESGITVSAPAIELTAIELVKTSGVRREVLGWAHSCHVANYACGQCRGCVKHYETWEALGWHPH